VAGSIGMRALLAFLLSFLPLTAQAQAPGGALDPESYVALSADDEAQLSLGGFRTYLERIRPTDPALYADLDLRLDALQERDVIADVIFGVGTGLGLAAAVAAIPVYTELEGGTDLAIGLVIAGVSTFVLGLVIQAIVRPGHGDLLALIDYHDELVGRR
jgi:hypothetical protein